MSIDPVDIVEMRQALKGIAELTKTFYDELKEQGFSDSEALKLTTTWLAATSGGSS